MRRRKPAGKSLEAEGEGVAESGPFEAFGKRLIERKRFKLSLNPTIYRAFRLRCRLKKRKPNVVVENFMRACLGNPILIDLAERLAHKNEK